MIENQAERSKMKFISQVCGVTFFHYQLKFILQQAISHSSSLASNFSSSPN